MAPTFLLFLLLFIMVQCYYLHKLEMVTIDQSKDPILLLLLLFT